MILYEEQREGAVQVKGTQYYLYMIDFETALWPSIAEGLADAPFPLLSDYGRKPAESMAPDIRYKYDVYTAAVSTELFVGTGHPALAKVCRRIRRGHFDHAPDDTMPIYLHDPGAKIMTARRAHACAVHYLT